MIEPKYRGSWEKVSQIAKIETPWLKLFGEKLIDDQGIEREYWRVEKPNGLLVITIQNGQFVLPKPIYRPGIQERTLDFCGGRVKDPTISSSEVTMLIQRELEIQMMPKVLRKEILTKNGWILDSSFSNVLIYAIIAELDPKLSIPNKYTDTTFVVSKDGIARLLAELRCLQCRHALYEARDCLLENFS